MNETHSRVVTDGPTAPKTPSASASPSTPSLQEMGCRSFEELISSGMLWLINRVALHPRGFALAIHIDDDKKAVGWSILGHGKEVWTMPESSEDEKFAAIEATLAQATRENETDATR